MAEQAVPSLSILAFLCKEPPIDGYSSRISKDRFDHAPDKQREDYMKDDELEYEERGMQHYHVLIDEYEVVECDEADHPNEMGIQQPTAHMNNNMNNFYVGFLN